MRIAIFGAGAVGGYISALLTRAGHSAAVIARGEHLRAIRAQGIRVVSDRETLRTRPVFATADPAQVGPVDAVIVAVKHFQLAAAARGIAPLVGRETVVAPLSNGLDAHQILRAEVREDAVVGGLCRMSAFVGEPGTVYLESPIRQIVVGELDGRKSPRVETLLRCMRDAGIDAERSDDIRTGLWRKFLMIASLSGVTAALGKSAYDVVRCRDARKLLLGAMQEVEAIAHRLSVPLPESTVDEELATIGRFAPQVRCSMQHCIALGRRFELEALSGEIVRLGQKVGIPTPVQAAIHRCLLPLLEGAGQSAIVPDLVTRL